MWEEVYGDKEKFIWNNIFKGKGCCSKVYRLNLKKRSPEKTCKSSAWTKQPRTKKIIHCTSPALKWSHATLRWRHINLHYRFLPGDEAGAWLLHKKHRPGASFRVPSTLRVFRFNEKTSKALFFRHSGLRIARSNSRLRVVMNSFEGRSTSEGVM